jgi:hypothetical protein
MLKKQIRRLRSSHCREVQLHLDQHTHGWCPKARHNALDELQEAKEDSTLRPLTPRLPWS